MARWWSQNLMEDYPDRWGGFGRHGRCKLHFERNGVHERSLGAEWAFVWDAATAVSFEADPSEREWTLHLGLWKVASLFLHVHHERLPLPQNTKYEPRKLGVSLHDGTLFWEVWVDPHSWSKADGWRNDSFNLLDWLLGKTVYEKEALASEAVQIPMPERTYPAIVTFERATWTRPRSFLGIGRKVKRYARVQIEPSPGQAEARIPIPGKHGGVSGLYDLTFEATTLSAAIGGTVTKVLRYREERGQGPNWVPSTL